MKILKMYVNRKYFNTHYYCLFDEIPELTYEEIKGDFVGSAVDERGNIIFSEHLKRGSSGAFAGREFSLKMKDGTLRRIKDYWWDNGSYRDHGEFMNIGAGTLEDLQKCYVYCSMNINRETFGKMLDDYYSREKEYEYYEIEAWAKMQYTWYPVIIDGKVFKPLMVNEKGHFAERITKKIVYPRENRYRYFKKVEKRFSLYLFKYEYRDGKRLVKIQRKLSEVLKESLPLLDEEIEVLLKGGR